MSDTSLVFNLIGRDRVTPTLSRVAGSVRASALASVAGTAAMGAAMASTAAWAIALGSAVGQSVGAIALLPAVTAAAAASVITLKLATFGLSDAWKATGQAAASGGSSAADSAKRVATAEREVRQAQQGLTDAQREARQAQLALTAAHVDATERLDDLSRSVAAAHLDEEASVLAVADAQRDLNVARRGGNVFEIRHADLAYRQSLQTLSEVRDRLEDVSTENQQAQAAGVEGSDEVQSALQRQADATRQLDEATHRLADAQAALAESHRSVGGAASAANTALAALSPNARTLILTARQLATQWRAVRFAVSDAVFAGVSSELRNLSSTYLPVARARLVTLGGAFNLAIRSSMGLARSKTFVADVDTVLRSTSAAATLLAKAVAPIVNVFVQVAAVGSSFLPQLAGTVLTVAQRFERWMIAARQSGQLRQWIVSALGVLGQLIAIGTNAAGIIAAVFRAGDASAGVGLLTSLQNSTAALRTFLDSAEGQQKLHHALATLRNIIGNIAAALPQLVSSGKPFSDSFSVAGTVVGFLAHHTGLLAQALPYLAIGFLLVKTAQTGANLAAIAMVPIRTAEIISNFALQSALRAHTTALIQNTVATRAGAGAQGLETAAQNVGVLARARAVVATVALRVASIAAAVATRAWAAGQWLLNVALTANPIGIIIMLIALLIVAIIYAWNHSETFRRIVTGAWQAIWAAIKFVVDWVVNTAWPWIKKAWIAIGDSASAVWHAVTDWLGRVVAWIAALPGRIAAGARGMFDGIVASARGAVNAVIRAWNSLDIGISVRVPSWVPFYGGSTFSVPDLIPDIPYLAKGGISTRAGFAVVGDAGPEVIDMPVGARVTPLSGAGGGPTEVHLHATFVDGDTGDVIRKKLIRWSVDRGGAQILPATG